MIRVALLIAVLALAGCASLRGVEWQFSVSNTIEFDEMKWGR